mgnify:CR=1 FL=1
MCSLTSSRLAWNDGTEKRHGRARPIATPGPGIGQASPRCAPRSSSAGGCGGGGGTRLRVLSESRPVPQAEPVEPGIEDGYLELVR